MFACKELMDLYESFEEVTGDAPTGTFFSHIYDDFDHAEAILYVLSLFDDALDEVYAAVKNAESLRRQSAVILKLKQNFLLNSRIDKRQQFANAIRSSNGRLQLGLVLDTLLQADVSEHKAVDRVELVQSTNQLIQDIQDDTLPAYPKQVLLMKLRAVVQIAQNERSYSDLRLRGRIKAIYADFCAEFEKFDKEYETTREMLLRWAKGGIGVGFFTLALTADVSTVAGLLTHTPALPDE